MIRINLLSREERRRTVPLQAQVPRAIIVATIVVITGMWGYWYIVKRDVELIRTDIAATQGEIAANQQIIRLVEQYTRDKKQLQERLASVQRLADAQSYPVRLLDGISQALPEGAWLSGITKISGKLIIQGYASTHFAVAELMLALQRLKPLIGSVELNFSERGRYEGRPTEDVERFEIVATLSE